MGSLAGVLKTIAVRRARGDFGRGLGLKAMLAAAKPDECPFCGEPRQPKADTYDANRKRDLAQAPEFFLTCGDDECRVTAYNRYYARDRRSA